MAYINLLPWRDAARKERQKQYLTILTATAVVSFFLIFMVNMLYSARIDGQTQRNRYLENEIKVEHIFDILGKLDELGFNCVIDVSGAENEYIF